MSTLKKVLWGILGLALLAGILYMIQPVELQSRDAFLWKIAQTESDKWVFALTSYIPITDGVDEVSLDKFTYPEANNWSFQNRKKLPFPENMQGYTVYFGEKIPAHIFFPRAKIYFLKNKWTGNKTRDDLVAHILPK